MKCNIPKGEKQKIDASAEMSLYELNQQLIDQLGPADQEGNEIRIPELKSHFSDYVGCKNNIYYMLLCKEQSYYTIFKFPKEKNEEVLERCWLEFNDIIASIGRFYNYHIDPVEKQGLELWIRPEGQDKPICYLFFAYDAGVVEVI